MRLCTFVTMVLIWLGVVIAPRNAHARMLFHFDQTSLVLESDAIVLARRAHATKGGADRTIQFTVIKSYGGVLKANEVVFVDTSGYDLAPPDWRRDPSLAGATPSDDMVLFLKFGNDVNNQPAYSLVASGLRIQLGGKVYRFEQFDNPGPYVPVPQGRDPDELGRDVPHSKAVTLELFEADLQLAIARAESAKAAMKDPDRHQRELLDLVGRADGDPEARYISTNGFYRDLVGLKALEALGKTGKLDLFLEGVGRMDASAAQWAFSFPFRAEVIAERASERGVPLSLRVAALRILGATRFRDDENGRAVARVVTLLDDPASEVRTWAALALNPARESSQLVDAFIARWAKESEPEVLSALLEQAQRNGFANRLARNDQVEPLVRAFRRGNKLTLGWSGFETAPWSPQSVVVEAHRAGAAPRTLTHDSTATISSWSSSGFGGCDVPVIFDPPLEPGTYDFHVTLNLTREPSVTASRRLVMRSMRVLAKGEVVEPIAAPVAAAPDGMSAGAAPPPSVAPKGCGCSIPGRDQREPFPLLLAAFGLGVLVSRRRARVH